MSIESLFIISLNLKLNAIVYIWIFIEDWKGARLSGQRKVRNTNLCFNVKSLYPISLVLKALQFNQARQAFNIFISKCCTGFARQADEAPRWWHSNPKP